MTSIADFEEFRSAICSTLMDKVKDKIQAEQEIISNSLLRGTVNLEIIDDQEAENTK